MRAIYFILLIAGLFSANVAAADDVSGTASLLEITNLARKENKYVLVEIFNHSVVESRMVRDRCFKDAAVRTAIKQGFIEYVLESGQQPEIEKTYDIKRFPTIILINPDGAEVDRLVGGFFTKTLLGALNAVTTGRSELAKFKEAATDSKAGVASHMALADALSRRGAKSEALAEYLWCLKQGPLVDAAGFHVAVDSILLRIDNLASRLPEAAAALEAERANVEARVKFDDPDSVKTAFEFNDVLQAHEQNLKLFDSLPAKSLLRRKHFQSVFNELVKQKRYIDTTAMLDLESYVNLAYPLAFDDEPSDESDNEEKSKHIHEMMEERRKQRISKLTATAVEALLGVDKLEKAKRLAGRALEEQASRDLKINLVHAADRTGMPCASEFLAWLEKRVSIQVNKPQ